PRTPANVTATIRLPVTAGRTPAAARRRARPHGFAGYGPFDRERGSVRDRLGFDEVAAAPTERFRDDQFGRAFVFERRLDRLQFGDAHAGVRPVVVGGIGLGGGLRGAHGLLRGSVVRFRLLAEERRQRDPREDADDQDYYEELEQSEAGLGVRARNDKRASPG